MTARLGGSPLARVAALLLTLAAAPTPDDDAADDSRGELDFLSTGGVVPSTETTVDVDVDDPGKSPPGDDPGKSPPGDEGTPNEDGADSDTGADAATEPTPAATEPATGLPASSPESQPTSAPAIEPWLATLPDCLAPLARRQLALAIKRDEKGVVIDHSCSQWSVAPILLRNVVVTGTYEGDTAAARQARLTFRNGEQTVSSRDVQIGDQMNGGAIVVAVGPGLVLLDAHGKLVAATDGAPVKAWRMIWHSGFVVASDGMSSSGNPPAAPGAGGRDISRAKAKVVAKPKAATSKQ